jgi:MATE family multidrug resistance protein
MTTTAEIAAAFGADDPQQQQQISVHALLLALLLGLLLTAVSPWLTDFSVRLMTTEPRLSELTTSYLQIRLLALPATLVNLNANANHGLWLALLLFMAARGISQALWLRSNY